MGKMDIDVTIKEKFNLEVEKIKSLKGKKRWEYIWEYYKIIIIALAIIILVSGFSIYNAIANPPQSIVLNVTWASEAQFSEFFDGLSDFLTENLVEDTRREMVDVFVLVDETSPMFMGITMRFVTLLAVGELDIMIAPREELVERAAMGMLMDISSLLPTGTEGLLWAQDEYGITALYGVSIEHSRILENLPFRMSDEYQSPYLGVFVTTSREEKVRQAMELFLE